MQVEHWIARLVRGDRGQDVGDAGKRLGGRSSGWPRSKSRTRIPRRQGRPSSPGLRVVPRMVHPRPQPSGQHAPNSHSRSKAGSSLKPLPRHSCTHIDVRLHRQSHALAHQPRAGSSRPSAQTAMPRTSGEPGRPAVCRPPAASARSPLLPMAISTLRTKRSRPMRLIGEPENRLRKPASSRAGQLGQAGRQLRPRLQLRLAAAAGELVPGADGQAVVAAIDAVAHGPRGTRAGSARDARWSGRRCSAARRAGRGPGRRWSGRRRGSGGRSRNDRSPARPARSSRSVRISPRNSQEPKLAGDQVGVLALPAQPRRLRQRLLQQRRGVDEHLHLAHRAAVHPAGQLLQPALDQLVIVAVARVDRDVARDPAAASVGQRVAVGRRSSGRRRWRCAPPATCRAASPRRSGSRASQPICHAGPLR